MSEFFQTNIVGLLGILLGFLGLCFIGFELAIRLNFLKKKFNAEENDRKNKKEWLDTQHATLNEMSRSLSENVAARLRRDSSWATEALERTKLGPYADTLFGERKNHFRDEKELIGQKFALLLLDRCKWLLSNDDTISHIYLCIDSGTTLYPFFRNLSLEIAKAYQRGEEWIKIEGSINIVTNNLPGIEALMEHGRINPADRFSPLAVTCKILPGSPLPIYSAITGEDTEQELQEIKKSAPEGSIFIGLTAGNWIRIRNTPPSCPVPLSRGGRHPEFKQKLIEICDESYVISPLGKIFAKMSKQNVNEMLNLDPSEQEPALDSSEQDSARNAYKESDINDEKAKNVKLISTYREQGRLLTRLSNHLGGALLTNNLESDDESFIRRDVGETCNVQFRFDKLPRDPYLEKEVEFPHPHTRKDEFIRCFTDL